VQQGGFYGWPYAYIGKHPMPGFAQLAPDKVEATITPDLLFTAHSSLLDLVFYEGDQFPAEYKGSLFVALKGSWNRSVPTGYKIVRVPFKGRPSRKLVREFRDRLLGFRRAARRGLGPPRRACGRQGRLGARCRRHRRHDLAHLLQGHGRTRRRARGERGIRGEDPIGRAVKDRRRRSAIPRCQERIKGKASTIAARTDTAADAARSQTVGTLGKSRAVGVVVACPLARL
jgi:hypothetical protein